MTFALVKQSREWHRSKATGVMILLVLYNIKNSVFTCSFIKESSSSETWSIHLLSAAVLHQSYLCFQ